MKYGFISVFFSRLFPITLLQLAGAAILGVGIWVKVDSGSVLNFLAKIENVPAELSRVLNVGYLLIAIGALLLVIGFLGCCGAVRESRCMLLLVRLLSDYFVKGIVWDFGHAASFTSEPKC